MVLFFREFISKYSRSQQWQAIIQVQKGNEKERKRRERKNPEEHFNNAGSMKYFNLQV
jgi:hypothetical protein